MCGIVGWQMQSGQAFDARVLERMSQAVAHRGPDDGGDFADARAGVALGHRRLSIIDLSDASHQPMVDAPSGVVLAYNGELYNFRALRAQLAAQGHAFRSAG